MSRRFQKICFSILVMTLAVYTFPTSAAQSRTQQRMADFMAANSPAHSTPSTAPAAPENPIKEFKGNGAQNTTPFSVPSSFVISWESNEMTSILVYRVDGQFVTYGYAEGEGQIFVPSGGNYYLQVSSMGKWKVKILPKGN